MTKNRMVFLVVPGKGEGVAFPFAQARDILRMQQTQRGGSKWQIQEGQNYKFENNELISIKSNRKSKKSPKQKPNSGGGEVSE